MLRRSRGWPGRLVAAACAVGVFFLGWPTAARAEQVVYYHVDTIGSVRAVTDSNGEVIERHDYYAFGEECTTAPCATPSPGQPLHFSGKERDKETGFDYFGARYYGSKIGRFTTVDPAMNLQRAISDPQQWNRYSYVQNRPLTLVDPDGRESMLYQHGNYYISPVTGASGFLPAVGAKQALAEGAAVGALQAGLVLAPLAVPALATTLGTPRGLELMQDALESVSDGPSARPASAGSPGADPPFIYRAGGSNPGNLTPRLGEEALSFRDSLSNPFPLPQGKRPVFGPGQPYIKVDTSKLPPASVRLDNIQAAGHVSVRGASPAQLKDAVVEKGKLP
jgi:RHS repeat-associated protein